MSRFDSSGVVYSYPCSLFLYAYCDATAHFFLMLLPRFMPTMMPLFITSLQATHVPYSYMPTVMPLLMLSLCYCHGLCLLWCLCSWLPYSYYFTYCPRSSHIVMHEIHATYFCYWMLYVYVSSNNTTYRFKLISPSTHALIVSVCPYASVFTAHMHSSHIYFPFYVYCHFVSLMLASPSYLQP